MLKVAFHTLGCKVNTYETDVMTAAFAQAGAEIVPFHDIADVYIVNTCTVTSISDKKSRQMLRQAKKLNASATVVAVGCYAQVAAEDLKKIPEIDLIIGNVGKSEIVKHVTEFREQGLSLPVLEIGKIIQFENMFSEGSERTRAVMKIEDGCNNFCTYCIIPYARGRVRSKPLENCVEEFQALCGQGFLEIVLTGIEIALYGADFGSSLLTLLEEIWSVAEKYPTVRVRLGSLEPRLITKEFAEKIAEMKFLCPHFHLSLQSGCDTVLKRMGRKYSCPQYLGAWKILKEQIPDVSLTTDIIVGFPGETEEEFLETVAFVEQIPFLKVHIFPYSLRSGTVAATMGGQVAKSVVAERIARLSQVCEKQHRVFMEAQRGKTLSVLIESEKNGIYSGHTPNYMEVSIASDTDIRGKIVDYVY